MDHPDSTKDSAQESKVIDLAKARLRHQQTTGKPGETEAEVVLSYTASPSKLRQNRKRKKRVDLKEKIEIYRTIFNANARYSDNEQKALAKMAELTNALEEDDEDRYFYMKTVVDYIGEGNDLAEKFHQELHGMLDDEDFDAEKRVQLYQTLLRSKYGDEMEKQALSVILLDLLEDL